ncbi:MAG: LuxR C-terminal-related transcriptional regulator [Caldilineaceae bacterium]
MHGRDYFNLAAYWPPVAPSAAEADAQEALLLAQQMGYRSGEVRARIWYALGLGPRGNYGEALAHAHAAQALATADQQARYIATADHALGALYLDLLALPLAEQHLSECLHRSTAINSPMMVRFAAGLLALVFIAQKQLDAAQQLLDHVLPVDAPLQSKSQRLIGCARAELCLARADPAGALAWVDRLLRTAVLPPVAGGRVEELVIPRLWQLRGEALFALHRWEEAEAVLSTALQAAENQGMRPLIWRIQGALARLYQQQRRREPALAALAAAQRIIDELAETVEDASLRQTFMVRAAEQLPNLAPPTPLQAAKSSAAGLTAREREVATLIAAGQANRTIAKQLIISERTVAKHVENILAKLNFTTRTQIAAWAVEKGLLTEQAGNPATKTRQQ